MMHLSGQIMLINSNKNYWLANTIIKMQDSRNIVIFVTKMECNTELINE